MKPCYLPNDNLIEVIKREFKPKRLKDLSPQKVFIFTGSKKGCSFTKVSCYQDDLPAARAYARSIKGYEQGATVIGSPCTALWEETCSETNHVIEMYLDTHVNFSQQGHVALRLKNKNLNKDLPISGKWTDEETRLKMNCAIFLKSIFKDDDDYL